MGVCLFVCWAIASNWWYRFGTSPKYNSHHFASTPHVVHISQHSHRRRIKPTLAKTEDRSAAIRTLDQLMACCPFPRTTQFPSWSPSDRPLPLTPVDSRAFSNGISCLRYDGSGVRWICRASTVFSNPDLLFSDGVENGRGLGRGKGHGKGAGGNNERWSFCLLHFDEASPYPGGKGAKRKSRRLTLP